METPNYLVNKNYEDKCLKLNKITSLIKSEIVSFHVSFLLYWKMFLCYEICVIKNICIRLSVIGENFAFKF